MSCSFSHRTLLILISGCASALFSCQSDSCRSIPDLSDTPASVSVVHWDDSLFAAQSSQDIEDLLHRHPDFAQTYLRAGANLADSALARRYYQLINNPSIDTLRQQAEATFGNYSDLTASLRQSFRLTKHYFPSFTPPTVYTTFTGLGTFGDDLLVTDSLLVVSTEFFIGPTARYRPQTHDYILNRYRPASLVPGCLLLLSDRFNATDMNDQSLIAEMIYYGKSYYFVQQTMPCLPDSTLLGYTSEQMRLVDENRQLIWSHFVDDELFFKSDQTTKTRYLGDRPGTAEINNRLPGQLGRWLGYQVVQAYAERTGASLPEVMQQEAQQIFTQARYRP
ncbi:MAG: DUF2268 domain-containing putative Zn-dependent protease [Tunicatimonas sp.]